MNPALYNTNMLSWIFNLLVHKLKVCTKTSCNATYTHYSDAQADKTLLILHNAAYFVERLSITTLQFLFDLARGTVT